MINKMFGLVACASRLLLKPKIARAHERSADRVTVRCTFSEVIELEYRLIVETYEWTGLTERWKQKTLPNGHRGVLLNYNILLDYKSKVAENTI